MQAATYPLPSMGHNNPPSEVDIVRSRLSEREADLRKSLTHICQQTPVPERIEDELQAGKLAEYIKNLLSIKKGVADVHKEIKTPYFECGKVVDTWKNGLDAELEKLKDTAGKVMQDFLDRKEEVARQERLRQAQLQQQLASELTAEAAAHENVGLRDTANELVDAAVQAEESAERLTLSALNGKPSNFARARSEHGATASQKLAWTGEIESLVAIDLEALRPHFTEEALQKAINAFVRNGGRTLAGVRIYQKASLNVR